MSIEHTQPFFTGSSPDAVSDHSIAKISWSLPGSEISSACLRYRPKLPSQMWKSLLPSGRSRSGAQSFTQFIVNQDGITASRER